MSRRECAASGGDCSLRKCGPNGELQCQYCGEAHKPADNAPSGRDLGTTTAQMLDAPQGAYFIWQGSHYYPLALARHLGRSDLRIEGMSFITQERWRGLDPKLVVIDHACEFRGRDYNGYLCFRAYKEMRS